VVSPDVYGELNLLQGVVTLGQATLCLPLMQAAMRLYAEAQGKGAFGTFRGAVVREVRKSVLLLLVLTIVSLGVWSILTSPRVLEFMPGIIGLLIGASWISYRNSLYSAARQRRQAALLQAMSAWARPLVAAALAICLAPRTSVVLLGQAMGLLLVARVLLWRSPLGCTDNGEAPCTRHREWRNDLWRFAFPLLPMALVNWGLNLSGRYVVGGFWGMSEVSIFAAASSLASMPILAAGSACVLFFGPIVYEAVVSNDRSKERKALLAYLAAVVSLSVSAVAGYWMLSKPVCAFLLPSFYKGAGNLMVWIASGYCFLIVAYVPNLVLYSRSRTKLSAFCLGGALLLNVTLNFTLIPSMGALGGAIATFGTFALYLLLTSVSGLLVLAKSCRRFEQC